MLRPASSTNLPSIFAEELSEGVADDTFRTIRSEKISWPTVISPPRERESDDEADNCGLPALFSVHAFLECGFVLMLHKNPEGEHVSDQQ